MTQKDTVFEHFLGGICLDTYFKVVCNVLYNPINDTQGEIRRGSNILWVVTEDFIER